MIGMKWRIWLEKILLLMRIRRQDENSLCRQVYEEGRARGWPGLGEEVAGICKEIGIPDINGEFLSKTEIKNAIFDHHYKEMLENIEGSKKLEDIKHEEFNEVQHKFQVKSVENTRMAFRVRCHMVPDIPDNFKAKYRKKGPDSNVELFCKYCEEEVIMSQSHCMVCPAWTELREGLDLTNIMDMAKFFRMLLTERARRDSLNV